MTHRTHRQTRRGFLRGCAAAAAGAVLAPAERCPAKPKNVKIARIDVFPVTYPMVSRFKFFEDPKGQWIGRPAVLVKVTADEGTFGWGQSVPVPMWSYETLESTTGTIRDYLAPVLVGRDPFDIVGAHKVMDREVCSSFSTGMPIAKAGVDLALHDLACKLNDQTLAQKWSRKSVESLTLSWTLNPTKLSEVEGLIAEGLKRGYQHFNVKVSPDPKFDLALCRLVKKRVPEGFLWADANGGYDLATAVAVAPKLADAGVDVLEQPLKTNRLAGYRRLKRQGALPIYMDEGVVSPAELIEFIRLDMLDGVAMKPGRCGGLLSNKRQIEIVLDAGLGWLGSGLCDPDVSLAATVALYGAFGYTRPAALNGPQFMNATVLKNPLVPKDGRLPVRAEAGLGVEVDPKKLEKLLVRKLMKSGGKRLELKVRL